MKMKLGAKLLDLIRRTQVVVRPPGYEDPARAAARLLAAAVREADYYTVPDGHYAVMPAAKWAAVKTAAKGVP